MPEEQEEEPESNILKSPSDITSLGAEEQQRKSIFIHSCPGRFSDINNARRSVFGSIFLRTTGRVFEEANLLKTVGESNYNMLQSFLTSFEKILSVAPSDSEKKKLLTAYKQSILRMLENVSSRLMALNLFQLFALLENWEEIEWILKL